MLTVFDMDGVFIEERSSWKLIHKKFGIDNSDLVKKYLDNEIDDEEFINEDIKRWREKGVRKKDIIRILQHVPLTKGAENCVKFFSKIGKTAIISGGIDILARRIAEYGIDYVFANGIEFRGEMPWKGILRVPIKRKDVILKNLMKKLDVKAKDVIVVGDTKYDLGMFQNAGIKIAFNARDDLSKHADFVIKEPDLNELIKIFEEY
ncbi:MAG TPA: HAD family hydrolase [Thermoplasmatales archaeon]|nr:HAD family hydrolase [Thermoplasmatales archaeon]